MGRRGYAFALAASLGLAGASVVLSAVPAGAASEAQLDCTGFDQRTLADMLPKPGVVVAQDLLGTTFYQTETVGSTGSLSGILISSIPDDTTPLVSVWEGGTDCLGLVRNAWAVTPSGQVFGSDDFSTAAATPNFGDMAGKHLNQPIVGMSPTADGLGYWLVASDGGIFTFGDARFMGSTGNIHLNKPIVGMSVTPDGGGYWMVASDGGIFNFGDARFYGSTGNLHLNRPITGMTATPDGKGYWMVASDGGIFTFGDAVFKGSTGGRSLSAPIAGMIPNGAGYTLIGQDGQLYPFG